MKLEIYFHLSAVPEPGEVGGGLCPGLAGKVHGAPHEPVGGGVPPGLHTGRVCNNN